MKGNKDWTGQSMHSQRANTYTQRHMKILEKYCEDRKLKDNGLEKTEHQIELESKSTKYLGQKNYNS